VLRSGWVSSPPVFWIFMEQGKIMEAEAPTVRVGASPTGLTAPHPHNPPRFFTGRMSFLPLNQQRQSTECISNIVKKFRGGKVRKARQTNSATVQYKLPKTEFCLLGKTFPQPLIASSPSTAASSRAHHVNVAAFPHKIVLQYTGQS